MGSANYQDVTSSLFELNTAGDEVEMAIKLRIRGCSRLLGERVVNGSYNPRNGTSCESTSERRESGAKKEYDRVLLLRLRNE
jgi:hypothetical protein